MCMSVHNETVLKYSPTHTEVGVADIPNGISRDLDLCKLNVTSGKSEIS